VRSSLFLFFLSSLFYLLLFSSFLLSSPLVMGATLFLQPSWRCWNPTTPTFSSLLLPFPSLLPLFLLTPLHLLSPFHLDNVAGVKLPVFKRVLTSTSSASEAHLGLTGGGKKIAACRDKFEVLLEALIKLASLQTSFVTLGEFILMSCFLLATSLFPSRICSNFLSFP